MLLSASRSGNLLRCVACKSDKSPETGFQEITNDKSASVRMCVLLTVYCPLLSIS